MWRPSVVIAFLGSVACGGGGSNHPDVRADPVRDAGDADRPQPEAGDAPLDAPLDIDGDAAFETTAADVSSEPSVGDVSSDAGVDMRGGDASSDVPDAPSWPVAAGTPGPFCTAGGWCWQHPLPAAVDMYDVWGSSANDVWVTADAFDLSKRPARTVLHWDGTRWLARNTPDGTGMTVSGTGRDDVWVLDVLPVGPKAPAEHAWHWNGTGWTKVVAPGIAITSLWPASSGDTWFAGQDDKGVWRVVRRTAAGWTSVGDPLPGPVHDISAPTNGEVWVVSTTAGGAADAYRWDGMKWQSYPHADGTWGSSGYTSVWALAGTDAYQWEQPRSIGGYRFSLARLQQGTWTRATSVWGPAISFSASTASDVWIVPSNKEYGDTLSARESRVVRRFDGTTWSAPSLDGAAWAADRQRTPMTALHRIGDEVWVVGQDGLVVRCAPGTCATLGTPLRDVHRFWTGDGGSLWALASRIDGQLTLMTLTVAGGWSPVAVPAPVPPTDLWAASSAAMWGLDRNEVRRFASGAWTTSLSTTSPLTAWYVRDDTALWVVEGRTTIRQRDASGWSARPTPAAFAAGTSSAKVGVWARAPDDLWLWDSAEARAWHWTGNAWSAIDLPGGAAPTGVWGDGTRWWLAAGRKILLWSGGALTPAYEHTDATTGAFTSIGGWAPDNVWAMFVDDHLVAPTPSVLVRLSGATVAKMAVDVAVERLPGGVGPWAAIALQGRGYWIGHARFGYILHRE